MADSLIAQVLQAYFPGWEPPENRNDWNKCLCPAHNEERPSCSVSFERNAVKCQACGFRGDAISIIKREEGIGYVEALKRAEEISGGSYDAVPRKSKRKRGRRVFSDSGPFSSERQASDGSLPVWLRQ